MAEPADWVGPAASAFVLAALLLALARHGGALGGGGLGWSVVLASGVAAGLVWLAALSGGRGGGAGTPVSAGLGAMAAMVIGAGGGWPGIAAAAWPLLAVGAVGGGIGPAAVSAVSALAAGGLLALAFPQGAAAGLLAGITGAGLSLVLAFAALARSRALAGLARSEAERAAAEARLRHAEAEAARAESAGRARFMAEMSHEIRTPLNHILGFSDMMREGVFGPLPPPYGGYADDIHKSGSALLDLVSDLLDLSKIDAGRYDLRLSAVPLGEAGQEAVRLSVGAARAAGVNLRLAAGAEVVAHADPRAVRQMALNLLSNAIKFTPAGGSVAVGAERAGDWATLVVADTGVGMSDAQLARIGQPYAQDDNQPASARGTGLGLGLVKRLAELHGGRLDLASAPGQGTVARVTLPLWAADADDAGPG